MGVYAPRRASAHDIDDNTKSRLGASPGRSNTGPSVRVLGEWFPSPAILAGLGSRWPLRSHLLVLFARSEFQAAQVFKRVCKTVCAAEDILF